MPAISALAKSLSRVVMNNSPKILTGMAVAGVVSTTVLAVKATPQALELIQDEEIAGQTALTPWGKVKVAWVGYVPAASVGAVTIACIIGGNAISTRRNAALMSLYTLTEQGFREYQDKAVEALGKQKEQKLRDDIAQDQVDRNPVRDREVMVIASGGVLFYDQISGRYFKSDMEHVRQSVNDINQKVINEMYASQNDFYRLIGLPILAYGEEIGWSTDALLEIDYSTTLSENKEPCIVLNYRQGPIRGYSDSFQS